MKIQKSVYFSRELLLICELRTSNHLANKEIKLELGIKITIQLDTRQFR